MNIIAIIAFKPKRMNIDFNFKCGYEGAVVAMIEEYASNAVFSMYRFLDHACLDYFTILTLL